MQTMLQLDDPTRAVPDAVLDTEGGFAWWYLEVEDDHGNGLVMIWSWGLPFLPGYVASARAGAAETPRERPSLNVVFYRGGKEVFYTLREYATDRADKGVGCWQFGDSHIDTVTKDGVVELRAELCLPVAGSTEPMRGTVQLTGRQPRCPEAEHSGAAGHWWTPLACPAFATARLEHQGQRYSVMGRAYHDRNFCDVGLQDIGVQTWLWGRAARPEGDRVFYVLWPEGGGEAEVYGWELCGDGAMQTKRALQADLPPASRTRYGMPQWDQLTILSDGEPWVDMKLRARVEDGPFYLRWQADELSSGVCHGTAEAIVPSRIDGALFRPLVRMRVATERRRNSVWLPLFDGPSADRLKRLLIGEPP